MSFLAVFSFAGFSFTGFSLGAGFSLGGAFSFVAFAGLSAFAFEAAFFTGCSVPSSPSSGFLFLDFARGTAEDSGFSELLGAGFSFSDSFAFLGAFASPFALALVFFCFSGFSASSSVIFLDALAGFSGFSFSSVSAALPLFFAGVFASDDSGSVAAALRFLDAFFGASSSTSASSLSSSSSFLAFFFGVLFLGVSGLGLGPSSSTKISQLPPE